MYHGDLNFIFERTISECNQTKFSDKIYNIIESYLPLLLYNGNIFQNVSSLKIPKSASTLYLETNQILQSFQQIKGVLGGCILYHNKVVASQLPDSLTKIITLSDLYRTKSFEHIAVNYHIPVGVTLINAYITTTDYMDLVRSSNQSYNLFAISATKDTAPFMMRKKSYSRDGHSMMKRDKSLIFTNIPEEGAGDVSGLVKSENQNKNIFSRPTNLPLLATNYTSLGAMESGFNSINFDESDSFPNFIGKTSVCSTPMTENKLLSHGNVLSICALNEDIDVSDKSTIVNPDSKAYSTVIRSNLLSPFIESEEKSKAVNYVTNLDRKSYNFSNKRASFPNINEFVSITNKEISRNGNEIPKLSNLRRENFCKTVADPTYPLFSANGDAVSCNLFKEFLNQHYNALQKCADDALHSSVPIVHANYAMKIFSVEMNNDYAAIQQLKNVKEKRKELNLPLKSLNIDLRTTEIPQSGNMFESPVRCKKMSGLQLTPLMTKLTLLAMNDQESSGVSSWDTTPGCSFNKTPLDYHPIMRHSKSIAYAKSFSDNDSASEEEVIQLTKVEIFICVQQNMTLVMVLQEKSSEEEEIINSLFETCISKLTRIEQSLHQAMSISVEGCDKRDGGYSFIFLDSKWDINNRCGPWNPKDLFTLNSLHNNFYCNRKLVEVTLRTQDAVVYAYRCGRSEIYYLQSSIAFPGLPPPQDIMGTISLCAKRRLERDHRILLL
ncbi:uncharacterized protein LOC131432790 isoform X2 [Malaya genurostris]|nr:uncharacterized protein LOC131432790 isoform X2 [Malaya genurostris]XP_058455288.1 uncharacterized protein LOC131432790 isoform X2 [Malaya genurostris]XP_058455289.1 uncharacterized protein LOC131432790 isoform X2 [Malaya genurostris]XP_058455290.1 uncharacterized protein LOC131432790 isoform X2 [Malaya genurostris]